MPDLNNGKGVPFERIRRITGYLTGALTTWNDAKKAEEKDRVRHSLATSTLPNTEERGNS